MSGIKKPSLIELRKKANMLGISDYAKYSKEELAELIAKKESEEQAENPEPVEASVEEASVEETPVEEPVAEEMSETPVEEPVEVEKETVTVTQEKKAKKEPKLKKESFKKKEASYFLKEGMTLEKIKETEKEKSAAVAEAIVSNDGRSLYKIAKDCGTYYSVVCRIINKYFDVAEKITA